VPTGNRPLSTPGELGCGGDHLKKYSLGVHDTGLIFYREDHCNGFCENRIDLYVRAMRVRQVRSSKDNRKAMDGRGQAKVLRRMWLAQLGCTEAKLGRIRKAR
jgi:hypothetical protein